MAIRTKRFISRGGNKVRAVKITEKNYHELAIWIGNNANNLKAGPIAIEKVSARGDISEQRIKLHILGKGIRVPRVGDYVFHVLEDDLKLTDGRIRVMKGSDFEFKYDELKVVK